MGYYSLFKYGTGVLYGPITAISAASPLEGPAPGGNAFVITGAGFDPRQWDDYFTGLVLDPAKWVDVSVGGVVSTGPYHLELMTGAIAGSTASVESVMQWTSTQGECRVIISEPSALPPSEVDVFVMTLWIDASNYAELYVRMDTQGNFKLCCESWVGGLKADELKTLLPWSTGLSIFKILRYNADLYFIANGTVVCRLPGFLGTLAKFRISTRNLLAAYDVNFTRVEWFYFRPFAVFQNQPVHDTVVVSDMRIRGRVPESRDIIWQFAAYEGLVDVAVVANGIAFSRDAYRYYFVYGLKTINSSQSGIEVSLINDAQLVTPSGESKGLGEGY